MSSTREEITQVLLTILGGVPGFVGVHRNRGDIDPIDAETKVPNLPAVTLLDGKQVVVSKFGKSVGGQMPPSLMLFQPEIWVLLLPRATSENLGTGEEMSAFEIAILKAIARDQSLRACLEPTGYIEYSGCDTDMQTGSPMEGQMRMNFGFAYVLDPTTL